MKTLTSYINNKGRIDEATLVPWSEGLKDAMSSTTLAAFKKAVLEVVAKDIFDDKAIMKRVQSWLFSQGFADPSGNCTPTERAMYIVNSYIAAFINAMRESTPSDAVKIDKAIRAAAAKVCKSCKGVKM